MSEAAIPLDELGQDAKRRDRYGRLLVVPPEGGKPVGYTRVTTIAKTAEDGGGLVSWKAAMAVCGALRRPGLRAQWEALLAAHQSPWYDGAKADCIRLVEESAQAGGGTDRREQGTALHAITALVDAGMTPAHLSTETERDLAAYRETLDRYGVTLDPNLIETTVVLDKYRVGGTFDRGVRVRGRELPLVADLKTGASLSYSGGSFAVQVATYAHGEAQYQQGRDPNGSADVRAEMPCHFDQHEGLIIWLPAGEGRCELHTVDLDAGWEGFQLALDVRGWRQQKPMGPFSQWVPADVGQDGSPTQQQMTRAWLQERINFIGHYSPAARADLLASWPPGLASLNATDQHTTEELLTIEGVCVAVEARNAMPFGATKPGVTESHEVRVQRRLDATFPGSTLTTEQELPT